MNLIKDILDELSNFVEYAFSIAEKHTQDVQKDSNIRMVDPVVIALSKPNNVIMVLPWEDNDSKIEMLIKAGDKCHEIGAYQIALITDTAMKRYTKEPEDETEYPLSYPRDLRIDCLSLVFLDLKDSSNNFMRNYPYKIVNKAIIREPEIIQEGNFHGTLMDSLIFGFYRSAMVEEINLKEITTFSKEKGDELFEIVKNKYPGLILPKPPQNPDVNKILS